MRARRPKIQSTVIVCALSDAPTRTEITTKRANASVEMNRPQQGELAGRSYGGKPPCLEVNASKSIIRGVDGRRPEKQLYICHLGQAKFYISRLFPLVCYESGNIFPILPSLFHISLGSIKLTADPGSVQPPPPPGIGISSR